VRDGHQLVMEESGKFGGSMRAKSAEAPSKRLPKFLPRRSGKLKRFVVCLFIPYSRPLHRASPAERETVRAGIEMIEKFLRRR
jgi:hypothetical protein